jgi:hypothetical protein
MSRGHHARTLALAALLIAVPRPAAAQSPGSAPEAGADAALLAAAKPALRGTVLASTRAPLPGGETALLVAVRPSAKPAVTYVLAIVGKGESGELALLARDELQGGALEGVPTVALSVGKLAFTAGAVAASVGWRAPDGRAEERHVLYRYGDRKVSQLLALPPGRRYPPGAGRPSELREIEVLPTGMGGYKDVRVRTRIVDCVAEGDCDETSEVVSYAFDGVRYVARPFAIPFLESITASSSLEERGGLADWTAAAAVDGRLDTAWCEGAKGAGWFEKLELTFVPAQRVKAVRIFPGLAGEAFQERTRPKRVRVLLPDGRKVEADLADEPKLQRVALPEGERVFGMTVVIVDVYKGKREDACIGELDVEVEP